MIATRRISLRISGGCRIPDHLPFTVLDATACEEELRSLVPREFYLLDVHANREGRRIWLRRFMGKVLVSGLTDEKLGH